MRAKATACEMCKKPLREKDSVFTGSLVCRPCYETETARAAAQDSVPGKPATFTRPPKYMLHPSQYAAFGY